MKKLLALALALFLLPAVAFSEDVTDLEAFFESCTFEELMNLNRVVQLYLFKKAALSDPDGVVIPEGEGYIVGEDFPAGTYRAELPGLARYEICILDVDLHDGGYTHTYMISSDGSTEIGKIYLPYGATVNVLSGPIRFFPYTGLFH